jgi:hypothetical protein
MRTRGAARAPLGATTPARPSPLTAMQHVKFLAACLVLSSTAAAQQTLIAEESFLYGTGDTLGAKLGGFGWQSSWWSGNNGDDAIVTSPGFDSVGEKITTNTQDGGSFRVPDVSSHTELLDANGLIGADNTTVWVSFWCQKAAGSTDQYGGFSFNEMLVAEQLFVGSPWQTNEWGIQRVGGQAITVPGTDPTVLTRFVVRVDSMPGDDRLRVWLNPTAPHPVTPADLDEIVADFAWNEVRFQSGSNAGGMTAWHFDHLVIEKEGGSFGSIGTPYCNPANANSTGVGATIGAVGVDFAGGQPLTLTASALPPNQFGYFITGMQQGFLPFAGGSQGNLCIALPVGRFNLQIQNSGATGEFSIGVDTLAMPMSPPVAIQSGESWSFQAWYRDLNPGATSNFTSGVVILFQ